MRPRRTTRQRDIALPAQRLRVRLSILLLLACSLPVFAQQSYQNVLSALASKPSDKQLLQSLKTAIGSVSDRAIKARVGAIYCLGCMANGLNSEWPAVMKTVQTYYPTDPHAALLTIDALGDICPECKGSGRTFIDCSSCKGTGKCSTCGGTGKIGRAGAERPCPYCRQSGACHVCDASGAMLQTCAKCSGRGRVWSPSEANEIYLKLLKNVPIDNVRADVRDRVAARKLDIEKAVAIHEKEKEYRKQLIGMDTNAIPSRIKIIRVIGQGALATGSAQGHNMPQQFLVDSLPNVVDGDTWNGPLYPFGRLQIAVQGRPVTLRVYTASKKRAAMAAVAAQSRTPDAEKPHGSSTGTGWFCGTGHIVTCYHVVKNRGKIAILSPTIRQTPAKLILKDEDHDLAVLEASSLATRPPGFPLATDAPSLGEEVFTIGFPHVGLLGKEPKFTDGAISSLAGLHDDPRTLQMSVPVQAGNSGGPLINGKGEVVGIVAAKLAAASVFRWTGDLPQNVNYAIKVGNVEKLLHLLKSPKPHPLMPATAAPVVDLTKRVQKSIVQIVAE